MPDLRFIRTTLADTNRRNRSEFNQLESSSLSIFFLSELTRLEGRITAAVRDQPDDFPEGSAQIKAIRTPLHLCNDETALASLELVTDMLS